MVYLGFEYVENILKCAKDGLQKPEDFGYWGPEDMFKTWGFCGVDKNRDSNLLEISNFEVITKDLMTTFPLDFRIENYSHWLVGNVDRLVCRILKHEIPFIDEVKQEDITIAFRAAMEWLDQLKNYPVADENDYSDKQFEEAIKQIEGWDIDNPGIIYKPNFDNWQERIYYELINLNCDFDDYNQISPTDEMFYKAIYKLGLQNEEQYNKWVEFCKKYNLDMPASFAEEFSKNNIDQLKLFEVKDVNRY
jgi:hypothetical protein